MFTKLTIKNFQIHKNLVVGFDPLVTTIVGPGNIGKSSILRALRWICLNEPTGNDFKSTGAKYVKVSLKEEGKKVVARYRGTKGNYYRIGREFRLRAFGTKVPDRIASRLRITEENFNEQVSAPFWFWLTPGQLSRELNRIVNLESIDRTLAAIGHKYRRSYAEREVCKQRLKAARAVRKELNWTKTADRALAGIESAEKELAHNRNRNASLASLIQDATKVRVALKRARARQSIAQRANDQTDALYAAYMDAKATCAVVAGWIEQIETAKENLCQARARQKELEKKLAKVKLCPTCGQPIQ